MTVHPPDLMPDLLTEAEAASLLHVSERTLRTIRAQGKIRYIRPSPRKVAYDRADLAAYLAEQAIRRRDVEAGSLSRPST